MADPFSLTAGCIGLLATLAGASIKLNDLRNDFVEAKAEIDSLLRELNDITHVLMRLRNSQNNLKLPGGLTRDLSGVLKNCERTAQDAEVLLLTSAMKRFRGFSWAITGKKEFLQTCRGLEAHKATLNIIVTLSSAYETLQLSLN
jgi:hypothetical protein